MLSLFHHCAQMKTETKQEIISSPLSQNNISFDLDTLEQL